MFLLLLLFIPLVFAGIFYLGVNVLYYFDGFLIFLFVTSTFLGGNGPTWMPPLFDTTLAKFVLFILIILGWKLYNKIIFDLTQRNNILRFIMAFYHAFWAGVGVYMFWGMFYKQGIPITTDDSVNMIVTKVVNVILFIVVTLMRTFAKEINEFKESIKESL